MNKIEALSKIACQHIQSAHGYCPTETVDYHRSEAQRITDLIAGIEEASPSDPPKFKFTSATCEKCGAQMDAVLLNNAVTYVTKGGCWYCAALQVSPSVASQTGPDPATSEAGVEADGVEAARPCTCHPDDSPPNPCPRQYALTECQKAGGGGISTCVYCGGVSPVSTEPDPGPDHVIWRGKAGDVVPEDAEYFSRSRHEWIKSEMTGVKMVEIATDLIYRTRKPKEETK